MKFRKVTRTQVQFDQCLKLYGLTADEKDKVKKDLTFDNPAYATTQRYSKYAYTTVPPYLTYYKEHKGYIEVPIGYSLSDFHIGNIIESRVYEKLDVAPFVLELRDSQKEAADSYIQSNYNTSILKGSIQMPTGKGKSILGLYLAFVLSCKTLIVVHKDDLVTGWQKDIALAFDNKVNPGLIKAKSRRVGHFLTIATVQTLNRLSSEELSSLYDQFGFVIQDEMHHCPASSFEVVSNFRARYKLGLTATPERTDGLAHVMNLYFGDFCYRFKHDVEDKDILPVKVIVQNHPLYFNPSCKAHRRGEKTFYKIQDLACPEGKELADDQKRLSEIPYNDRPKVPFQVIDDFVVRGIKEQVCRDILKEFFDGHSCIVFFTQKEHCRLYYEYLLERVPDYCMGLLYGDNSNNDEVLEKAEKTRRFITLTTYAKATEGTNVKQWEVEFLVSSINNEKNTEQAVGRIRRTKEGKINPVIVYDYRTPKVYSVSSHGKTRDARYRQLHFTYEGEKFRGLFSRGYK